MQILLQNTRLGLAVLTGNITLVGTAQNDQRKGQMFRAFRLGGNAQATLQSFTPFNGTLVGTRHEVAITSCQPS